MEPDPAELNAFYRRYLQRCNEHRFDELEDFVAEEVAINGRRQSRREYGLGLRQVIDLFPDFHWTLCQLLIDGNALAARLDDVGTAATGQRVAIREFATYRIDDGRIGAVWGDLDRDFLSWTIEKE